jgi:hypothetical protein
MTIDQRNNGASVTPTNGQYTVDRWLAGLSQTSKYSVQQNAGSVTPPPGFTNYFGVTSLSSYSVGSGEAFFIRQLIEGFNVADLAWGTANAQPVTISFWVRSSLTGTFGVNLVNNAGNRAYPAAYVINASNTWEYKTVTVAGDTTGTWLTNNSAGIAIAFGLGYGSSISGTANAWNAGTAYMPTGATSVVGTNGATFYVTGVQIEKGQTATSFDVLPYTTELALCQRYFEILAPASIMLPWSSNSQITRISSSFQVTKRATPTIDMRTKGGGTGTMGAASVSASGVTYFGSGNLGDVIEYPSPTASIEL